ncbi:MAG: ATP-binding cassette domain-containing protein [Eubacterium sp.]|nr:ATP-binding cassette domain-containing protein [Eubacterium sp.]
MRYIFENLKKYWKSVLLLAVLLIVQGFCEMSMPQYTQNIIDVGIQNKGIEHIMPSRVTADEYRQAQIFMDASQKKEWTDAYTQKNDIYVLRDLDRNQMEALDESLLTPVVMAYQLGHMTEDDFRKMVKSLAEAAVQAQPQGTAIESTQAQGTAAESAQTQGTAAESTQAQGTGTESTQPQGTATDSAQMQSDQVQKQMSQIDTMSVEEIAKQYHLDISTFQAEDESGKTATYVDVRPAIQQMLQSGQVTDDQINEMKQNISDTISKTGSQTMKAMAIRYAADAEKAAGVDVDAAQKQYLWTSGGKMMLMALLMALVAIVVSFMASRVGAGVGRDLREKVFHNVIGYSSAEMEKFQTSSLITRATNDVQQVQMVTTMMLRMVLYAPVLAIWGIVKVYQSHANMSWVIVLGIAVIVGILMVLVVLAMPKFKSMQKLVDRLNLVSREILTGLMVVRAFGREKTEEKRFDDANRDLMRTQLFTNRVMTFMMPSMMFLMSGISVLITWVAAHRVNAGTLQVGAMTSFITYSMIIISSFMILTAMSIILPRAGVAAERINEVVTTMPTIKNPDEEKHPVQKQGVVRFDHVSFRYPGSDLDALKDISFTAKPGQTTAIIGSTGSGKSTLVNLIPRFYDVTGGSVSVDGVDIRSMNLHTLRDEIGFVPQKGTLFSGTIASNIRFGKPDASDEEVKRAAEIAQADDFIMEKEDAYDSYISQGGGNVSGGQKQRLSIARAIAKNPLVLVFDDSFSALDMKTDARLREELARQEKDATKIIVAQRVSTILNADQILVLDEGELVGAGTHAELLDHCEVYRQIAASQLSQKELEETRHAK